MRPQILSSKRKERGLSWMSSNMERFISQVRMWISISGTHQLRGIIRDGGAGGFSKLEWMDRLWLMHTRGGGNHDSKFLV